MTTYSDLQPGKFYLIREDVTADIEMVAVLALTDKCLLLRSFGQEEMDFWKLRKDIIHEVIEELDYESASAILALYDQEGDDYDDEDEEDEV
ncbi:hypothetical protein [Flavihumibacter fluvii]|uniref:hypothetical protein n=1 Tax=Flavihumibacter fluvii TaxID=2838157 RepID=UPI001BDF2267|nr:hypothetical protein [Flavihumibacter fluvii]ULQ53851.1 hypothetical protein KJS93_05895 [Flavihumibacter fluvii]